VLLHIGIPASTQWNTFERDQTAGLLFLLCTFLVSGEKHIKVYFYKLFKPIRDQTDFLATI
jgi:hypothetical protein